MCRPSEWELELLKKHAGCMLRKCDRIEEVILVFLAFDLYSVLWHTTHFWGIEALKLHLHVYFLAFRPISMNQCNSRCRNVFRNLETNFYRETNLTVWTWLTAASVVTVSQRKNLVNPPPPPLTDSDSPLWRESHSENVANKLQSQKCWHVKMFTYSFLILHYQPYM